MIKRHGQSCKLRLSCKTKNVSKMWWFSCFCLWFSLIHVGGLWTHAWNYRRKPLESLKSQWLSLFLSVLSLNAQGLSVCHALTVPFPLILFLRWQRVDLCVCGCPEDPLLYPPRRACHTGWCIPLRPLLLAELYDGNWYKHRDRVSG